MASIKFKVRIFGLVLLGLVGAKQTFTQTSQCFGTCMGTIQVQPAINVSIDSVRVRDYTDNIGSCTQIVVGGIPMHVIPGHYSAEIRRFLAKLANDGFTTVDVIRFSTGGYKVEGRLNPKQPKQKTGCNLTECKKPLGKMKSNRDRKHKNEGCEWATGRKPLRKMKTNRDRDKEGCEWASGGKSMKKMRTSRKRDNEGCSETFGKNKRKTKPSLQKPSGCELAKPGRKGQYSGRRRTERSPCYD